ncbi:MAG: MBL fold metallo-hydrolase [Aureispira sp.]
MKIHHLRNATLLLETARHGILVDPMLGPKGHLPTLTFFRHKARKNPIVELPTIWEELSKKVTHCIITHLHPDHIDAAGKAFLRQAQIPVYCSYKDAAVLKKAGLNVVQTVEYNKRKPFLEGNIEGIPAKHGYGFIAKLMGNVMGFYIELQEEPSIYISADTIYTPAVQRVLSQYQPQLSIVAGGSAQLDIFQPLLMTVEDILKFVQQAPGNVLINHLEAVNHCPTTRRGLQELFAQYELSNKVFIPEDGEVVTL